MSVFETDRQPPSGTLRSDLAEGARIELAWAFAQPQLSRLALYRSVTPPMVLLDDNIAFS